MVGFLDMWGGGSGPAVRLCPSARLLCGTSVLVTGLLLPVSDGWGCVTHLLLLAAWLSLCRPPLRRAAAALVFALVLFLPPLLAVALVQVWGDGVGAAPAVTGARGVFCVLASVATLSTLRLTELQVALVGLKVPGPVVNVVVQVAHQMGLMLEESRRVTWALRMRGLCAARVADRLRCVREFPVVWLLRLLERAERVGAAMSVRGFSDVSTCAVDSGQKIAVSDWFAGALAGALLCAGLSARMLA